MVLVFFLMKNFGKWCVYFKLPRFPNNLGISLQCVFPKGEFIEFIQNAYSGWSCHQQQDNTIHCNIHSVYCNYYWLYNHSFNHSFPECGFLAFPDLMFVSDSFEEEGDDFIDWWERRVWYSFQHPYFWKPFVVGSHLNLVGFLVWVWN